jgi:hypothetical protein
MVLVPRRPAKRPPGPKANPAAKNMIDALAAVGFDDIDESLIPSEDDIEGLLDALMLGVLDEYLDHIAAIVKIRRDIIAGVTNLVALSLLNPGDRVQFNETAKPRYLVGLVGTITGKEIERCVVQLDEPVGRYADREVKARALYLRPLAPE